MFALVLPVFAVMCTWHSSLVIKCMYTTSLWFNIVSTERNHEFNKFEKCFMCVINCDMGLCFRRIMEHFISMDSKLLYQE